MSSHSGKTGGVLSWNAARFFSSAITFFFPQFCILCNRPRSSPNKWLCKNCLSALRENNTNRNACPRCAQNRSLKACACDIVWDYPFEACFSLFDYDDLIQKAAYQFKYEGFCDFAAFLGAEYADLIPNAFLADVDAVVPVPLHFSRKYMRGYNQAEYLALGVVRGLCLKTGFYPQALLRRKFTRTQTKLNKEQRMANLENAFKLRPGFEMVLREKIILLVDDIVTTGATTSQCTEILLKTGVKAVKVLSLARD